MGQHSKQQPSHYRDPRRRRERERTRENICRDYSGKLPSHGKGNGHPSPGSAESQRKHKPKEKHAETHSNLIDKN